VGCSRIDRDASTNIRITCPAKQDRKNQLVRRSGLRGVQLADEGGNRHDVGNTPEADARALVVIEAKRAIASQRVGAEGEIMRAVSPAGRGARDVHLVA